MIRGTNFFLLAAIVLTISCRNESCMDPMDHNLNIHFLRHGSLKDSAIFYFTSYGIGNEDSLIYYHYSKGSQFKLPLNLVSDTSQFYFEFLTLAKTYKDSTHKVDSIIPGPVPDTVWKPYTYTVKYIYDTNYEILTAVYKRSIELVSHECGFSYGIKLDSVWSTMNVIDSIAINKASIERGSNEDNVKIFL